MVNLISSGFAKHYIEEKYPTSSKHNKVWAIKQSHGSTTTTVLIQDELDTPTTNIFIEEEQERPPFGSRRQGLAHHIALIYLRVILYSLLWHSRFSLAVTHCAVLRKLIKFWCALKKTVLNFWLNWLWLCSDDSPYQRLVALLRTIADTIK